MNGELRRVVTLSAPRMAAANPLETAPPASPRAVFVYGVDRVLAACRMKSALPAEQSADGDAVEQDKMDQ